MLKFKNNKIPKTCKIKFKKWKNLSILERPYAYDPKTETAYNKEAYKKIVERKS